MTKCNCVDPDMATAKEEYDSIFKDYDIKVMENQLKDILERLHKLEQQNCHNHNGCWNCPHIRKRYCNYNSLVLCEFDMCSQNCPYYPGTYVPYGAGTVTWL